MRTSLWLKDAIVWCWPKRLPTGDAPSTGCADAAVALLSTAPLPEAIHLWSPPVHERELFQLQYMYTHMRTHAHTCTRVTANRNSPMDWLSVSQPIRLAVFCNVTSLSDATTLRRVPPSRSNTSSSSVQRIVVASIYTLEQHIALGRRGSNCWFGFLSSLEITEVAR